MQLPRTIVTAIFREVKMEKVITKFSLLVTGGWSKERLIPALVIAERLRRKGVMLIFSAEKNALEFTLLKDTGYEVVETPPYTERGGFFNSMKRKIYFKPAVAAAEKILHTKKIDAVLVLGGPSALPVVAAAKSRKIPVLVMEQNCVLSPVNEEIAPIASRIYAPLEETATGFDRNKFFIAGVPVRHEILDAAPRNIPTDKKLMCIFSCKKNSNSINELVKSFFKRYPEIRKDFFVIHETGEKEVADLQIFYDRNGIESLCYMNYESRGKYYKTADILICRPSSDIVSEILGTGKPAVFIALPEKIDPHQIKNAAILSRKGCGYVVSDSGSMGGKVKKLHSAITNFLKDPDRMKQNIRDLHFPTAANRISDDIYATLTKLKGKN
jgi:UDP-N-acetylglucosamine--N-acetylmuramyl-(pentapeptide) pyrophosphoryl-undecaprenol N-acetylglucosamine transferase